MFSREKAAVFSREKFGAGNEQNSFLILGQFQNLLIEKFFHSIFSSVLTPLISLDVLLSKLIIYHEYVV